MSEMTDLIGKMDDIINENPQYDKNDMMSEQWADLSVKLSDFIDFYIKNKHNINLQSDINDEIYTLDSIKSSISNKLSR